MLKAHIGMFVGLALVAVGLSGCQPAPHQTATQSASTSVPTAPRQFLAGVKKRGLAATQITTIADLELPKEATSGVSFIGASDVKFELIAFKTQAAANQARSDAVSQGKRAYSDRRLVLSASTGLGKGWFEKYRDAIFKQ
ncbi:hypothetical protein ACFQ5J_11455 [Lacticaseibacillus baoqingensis]|uniref:Lipoprotein n=1 Tax=Lacticaseibacillus baoqingensis TaxID=2486013 RepID=A0ABW4E7F3_9LACO|nr:hypothetical protein [Lacticaseibacillus baoqingensis]